VELPSIGDARAFVDQSLRAAATAARLAAATASGTGSRTGPRAKPADSPSSLTLSPGADACLKCLATGRRLLLPLRRLLPDSSTGLLAGKLWLRPMSASALPAAGAFDIRDPTATTTGHWTVQPDAACSPSRNRPAWGENTAPGCRGKSPAGGVAAVAGAGAPPERSNSSGRGVCSGDRGVSAGVDGASLSSATCTPQPGQRPAVSVQNDENECVHGQTAAAEYLAIAALCACPRQGLTALLLATATRQRRR
jgi:hypothetical protein